MPAKASSAKPKSGQQTEEHHAPLYVDYETAALGAGKLKVKKPASSKTSGGAGSKRRHENDDLESEEDEEFVDAALSRKILQIAREQQREIEGQTATSKSDARFSKLRDARGSATGVDALEDDDGYEDYDDDDDEEDYAGLEEYETEALRDYEADDTTTSLFSKFLPPLELDGERSRGPGISLGDKIMEKLAEHEMGKQRGGTAASEPQQPEFPPKVVEVYEKVGLLLSRYRSGRLPKAFKIIPALKNWEDVLFLTQPDMWSPNACYEATKLFVSSLKSKQSQLFLSDVLLDRVRDDIRENKTLNYHLYRSLKKSLYKPAAFFKGFLFPLCESGTCTLKEAIIVSSVLAKVSIPALHSSAALLRLAEMESYSLANSLFMRVLIDKKYALPYKVIDALVFHFMRFRSNAVAAEADKSGVLPVMWYRAFLAFAQRYKNDITAEQRDALLEVIRVRNHAKISPEIRRELKEGTARDNLTEER
ncbi:Bystin-domain-containing protein [Limtongia smithiae]|uniref:Bystin-domain-containing protein n=1 Tax=Limtongia smithiae TaxID=1125753 RepID=UPI0034CF6604